MAPAKLTLSLRITGVRDDGYHLIDAEMVSLDLADELVVTEESGGAPGASELSWLAGSDDRAADVPLDDDNLVHRALVLAGRRASVGIRKRIPHGGGLGGGSADAAAILRWAGWRDLSAAARLGADVPFCLVGGRARVRGIGELVTPLPHVDRVLTLALAPYGCSTPAVYGAWDRLGGPSGSGPNDLEAAAMVVEPRLRAAREALGEATGETPVLAGSGATLFVPGAHPGPGRLVVRTVRA